MPVGSAAGSGSNLSLPLKKGKEPIVSSLIPSPNPNPNLGSSCPLMPIDDVALDHTDVLSREEVLRRRSRSLKQLLKVYRRHYWSLAEEIKVKHKYYYWEFGKSPLEPEEDGDEELGLGLKENGGNSGEERKRCGFSGCKAKAMPLSRFCHQHILADSKQTLYKPCAFVTKSAQSVHITCGKPVLRSAVPCLCPVHHARVQRQISQALKKAGVSAPSSSRPAPRFHVLVSECVRQIQARRRPAVEASPDADKTNNLVG